MYVSLLYVCMYVPATIRLLEPTIRESKWLYPSNLRSLMLSAYGTELQSTLSLGSTIKQRCLLKELRLTKKQTTAAVACFWCAETLQPSARSLHCSRTFTFLTSIPSSTILPALQHPENLIVRMKTNSRTVPLGGSTSSQNTKVVGFLSVAVVLSHP